MRFCFFSGNILSFFSAYLPVFCRAFPQPGASPQPSPEGEGEAKVPSPVPLGKGWGKALISRPFREGQGKGSFREGLGKGFHSTGFQEVEELRWDAYI